MPKAPNEEVRAGLVDLCDALGLTEPAILWEMLSPDGAFMEAVGIMAEMLRLRRVVKGGALSVDEGQQILETLTNKPDVEGVADMGWNDETRRAARIDWLGRYGLPTGTDESERTN